jgi:diguanylate cyclase
VALAGRERRQLARRTIEARTDDLTGLANRRSLYEATERALLTDGRVAILLLDLNRFKELNDTLGHHMGDELLCQVAARMSGTLPPNHLVAGSAETPSWSYATAATR